MWYIQWLSEGKTCVLGYRLGVNVTVVACVWYSEQQRRTKYRAF